MAVKIRLKRLGKIRVPQYRIVVVDSRKKRDGRVLEEIGKYHPKEEPSFIEVTSDRAQYWLGVGAQPSEAVEAILKVTGDWQKFKGLPGAEGTLKVKEPKRSKLDIFNEALKEVSAESKGSATTTKKKAEKAEKTEAEKAEEPAAAPAEVPASETPEGAAEAAEAARDGHRRGRRQERGVSDVLAEALEHLVRGIVDHPDDVVVRDKQMRRGSILEVRVHPDDLGKVIGRNGRTATAFRTVVSALAGRGGARVDFVDTDRRR